MAVDPLLELLDEARAAEASGLRGRERSLRRAAEEDARLSGALLDLAERRSTVTITTTAGRAHHGVVVAVGGDFCVVRGDAGGDAFVRLDAVTTVRPHPGERHPAATGERLPPTDLRLLDVLGAAVDQRPRVVLVSVGGAALAGELRAVGSDLVTVRLDGDGAALCYVSASSLVEAVVLRSG